MFDQQELEGKPRKELQELAKQHGIKANMKTTLIIKRLIALHKEDCHDEPQIEETKQVDAENHDHDMSEEGPAPEPEQQQTEPEMAVDTIDTSSQQQRGSLPNSKAAAKDLINSGPMQMDCSESLVPCETCGRTFFPEVLARHAGSCKERSKNSLGRPVLQRTSLPKRASETTSKDTTNLPVAKKPSLQPRPPLPTSTKADTVRHSDPALTDKKKSIRSNHMALGQHKPRASTGVGFAKSVAESTSPQPMSIQQMDAQSTRMDVPSSTPRMTPYDHATEFYTTSELLNVPVPMPKPVMLPTASQVTPVRAAPRPDRSSIPRPSYPTLKSPLGEKENIANRLLQDEAEERERKNAARTPVRPSILKRSPTKHHRDRVQKYIASGSKKREVTSRQFRQKQLGDPVVMKH